MRKKKDRGKKYRRTMRIIQRYRNTYKDGYRKISPSIVSKHRIMEDGRVLTREELRDIFDICDDVILLEKIRLQVAVDGNFSTVPDKYLIKPCKRIIKYYSKYRNTEINQVAAVILYEVKDSIFRLDELPFLRVSYDSIAGIKEKKNEEGQETS